MRAAAHVVLLPALVTTALLVPPAPAAADDYSELGAFERETVDAVLKERGLTLDHEPEGKVVGRIHVVNRDVFSDHDGFLQWFNVFHTITREHIVEREVLLVPGKPWSEELKDETVRRLRDPMLSNVVAVLPVRPPTGDGVPSDPAAVDVLVVTRDVWSLRFNSDFQFQGDTLSLLAFSLAENNLFGWRKKASVFFNMDIGAFQIGPHYSDPNIGGTRLVLDTSFAAIFDRETGDYEGTRSKTTFEYPLWSLVTPWGGGVTVQHFDSVVREFLGAGVRSVDLRATPIKDALPKEYRYTLVQTEASAVHAWGSALEQRLHFGHSFYVVSAEPLSTFPGDATQKAAFEAEVLPPSELSSGLFVGYHAFTPVYGVYRDLRTYDLREDYLLGPELTYRATQALELLGSDRNHLRLAASFGYAFDPGRNSYLKILGTWSGRLQDGELVDHLWSVGLYGVTPRLWNLFRVVTRFDYSSLHGDTQNSTLSIGGDQGLRGYPVGAFTGFRRVRLNMEWRTMPLALWFLRIGGVLFWDMGHSAATTDDLVMHHDLGVGVRILIPQVNPYSFRVDWAFPTQGQVPGWPGRWTFGFFQVF